MLTACSVLQEGGDKKNIRINLPPIVSAAGNSRAISDDRIPTLKTETRKYRVTVNGMTREGTDSSYEFTLTVGTRATVTVECLNSSGEVIIRAVKDFTVAGGENSVSINLKADGTEITPASAQNQVTYSYGDANNGGEKRNLPANEKVAAGETFTVPDVSQSIYWAHGNFTGWSASVGLEQANGGQAVTNVPVAGGAYIMPSGGVMLTAQWTATPYTINYDTSISGGGSGAQASGGATSFTMAESDDKQLSSTSDGTGANTFLGWATASGAGTANIDGTSDIRKAVANGSLQIGGNNNVTLYAVWTNLPTHTVTFDDSQLQGQEYWQGNSSNNTVNIIDGRSVSVQQVQSFLNGGAKQNYTLTYNGSGSGAITSAQNFTIDASKVSFNTTYTVTIDFSGVSNEAWWQAGSSTTATKSVAKGSQLSAQDIQTEIDSRKKSNYNVTYSGGNKTVSSASDINVAITTGDLNVKELFSITYSWGTGVTVTAGNLPQTQNDIVQGTNATVTIPTGVTRSGYNFLGWSETDNDTSGTATYRTGSNTITGIGKSYTLYAVWTAITYTITYDANGGGTNPGNTTFTVETANVSFASSNTLSKDGYRFETWETTSGTDVSNMTSPADLINLMGGGTTLALRAKWEINYKSDKANWEVGDIVCENGNALTLANYNAVKTDPELSPAVAVVYKNDSANSKVYIVGKVHDQEFSWSNSTNGAQGDSMNITGLQKEQGYTDGSTGLAILQAAVTDANGSDLADKYPAWDFACNYGTKQGLTNFQTGWYFPSKDDLQEVYDNKDSLNTALAKIGVSKTLFEDTDSYWCSTQVASNASNAYDLWIKDGNPTWDDEYKDGAEYYVCAVCQLPYY